MQEIISLLSSSGGMIVGVLVSVIMGLVTNLVSPYLQSQIEKRLVQKKLTPFIANMLEELGKKLKTPKWYHTNLDAIDPGLIEVAIAITAGIIALPSIVDLNSFSASQTSTLKFFMFFGEFIPTVASINLLDRYAKNKGSKSKHILLAPIEDGSFFLLGWSIVLAFLIISIVVFLVS